MEARALKIFTIIQSDPTHNNKIAQWELLFNRTVKGYLPELPSRKISNRHKEAKESIEKSEERNKESYDKRHHAKESNIKEGDIVICPQKKRNKLTPKFSPERFTVISRKGTRLVDKNKHHILTRNVFHFKKVNRYETTEEEDDYTDGQAKDTSSNIERDLQNCEDNQQARLRRSRRSRIPIQRYGTVLPSNLMK